MANQISIKQYENIVGEWLPTGIDIEDTFKSIYKKVLNNDDITVKCYDDYKISVCINKPTETYTDYKISSYEDIYNALKDTYSKGYLDDIYYLYRFCKEFFTPNRINVEVSRNKDSVILKYKHNKFYDYIENSKKLLRGGLKLHLEQVEDLYLEYKEDSGYTVVKITHSMLSIFPVNKSIEYKVVSLSQLLDPMLFSLQFINDDFVHSFFAEEYLLCTMNEVISNWVFHDLDNTEATLRLYSNGEFDII